MLIKAKIEVVAPLEAEAQFVEGAVHAHARGVFAELQFCADVGKFPALEKRSNTASRSGAFSSASTSSITPRARCQSRAGTESSGEFSCISWACCSRAWRRRSLRTALDAAYRVLVNSHPASTWCRASTAALRARSVKTSCVTSSAFPASLHGKISRQPPKGLTQGCGERRGKKRRSGSRGQWRGALPGKFGELGDRHFRGRIARRAPIGRPAGDVAEVAGHVFAIIHG